MFEIFKNIFITVLLIKYTYCKYVSNNKTGEEINQSEYMISIFNTATDHEKQDSEIAKQRNINFCDDDPCDLETTFCAEYEYEDENIDDFICNCKPGYRLNPDVLDYPYKDKCIEKNFCDDDPCDQETTVCEEDYQRDFLCKCKPGYRLKPGAHELLNKDKCIAKIYCDDDPCDRETTFCEEDYFGDFVCKCKKGYRLKPGADYFKNKDACIVKNYCDDNPCDQETTKCVEHYLGDFICVCIEGYKLNPDVLSLINKDKCIAKKTCADNPCDLETAVCEDRYNEEARCICKPGYKPKNGWFETQNKDKCINCTCENGECVMKEGKVVCECMPGYGKTLASKCIACNCGEGANCTISGIWTNTIHCICKEGFTLDTTVNKCIENGTTPEIKTISSPSTDSDSTINSQYPLTNRSLTPSSDSILHFSTESRQLLSTKNYRYPLIYSSLYHTTNQQVTTDRVQPASTDIDQLVSTDTTESTTTVSKKICDCGKHSSECQWNNEGNKICTCFPGYAQFEGTCAGICQPNTCGHGECKVIDSHYVCRCSVGYVGRNCERKSKHAYDDVLIISILFLIIFYIIIGLAVILLLRRTKKHGDKCKKEKKKIALIKYYPVIEQSAKCLNL